MKLLTYNINGIRSVLKKDFIKWISAVDADIICLQEIKALESQFDKSEFEELGYSFHIFPAEKKGYSGVGLLSKLPVKLVRLGCGIDKYDCEGRIIQIDLEGMSVISVYMPSGASRPDRQVYKMHFLHDFYDYIDDVLSESPNLIIGGDFNLCHRPIDIHNPIALDGYPGFTPEERAWMTGFLQKGFRDSFRKFNPEPHNYSWWSYRAGARQKNLGWRIDYLLISESLNQKLIKSRHLSEAKHSDHCPVEVYIDV